MSEPEEETPAARYTNLFGIDLSLAVWLLADSYDFIPGDRSISATSLLRPTKQTILGYRVDQTQADIPDLSDRISLRLGHAIHDSVEQAWKTDMRRSMILMGIPKKTIDRIKINPEPDTLVTGDIPVYIEKRGTRSILGWTVSGKMDMSINGKLKDIKSTSVYTYLLGRKDSDYILQGSIYKWIHPDKVTADDIDIQFVFTDWNKMMSRTTPDYPEKRLISYSLPLMAEKETERFIKDKINEIVHFMDADQDQIPRCTDEELWRSKPTWKYYSDPSKTDGRSTKNFDNAAEANAMLAEKGKGVVKYVPGEVKACLYCRAFSVCNQRKEYEFND